MAKMTKAAYEAWLKKVSDSTNGAPGKKGPLSWNGLQAIVDSGKKFTSAPVATGMGNARKEIVEGIIGSGKNGFSDNAEGNRYMDSMAPDGKWEEDMSQELPPEAMKAAMDMIEKTLGKSYDKFDPDAHVEAVHALARLMMGTPRDPADYEQDVPSQVLDTVTGTKTKPDLSY